MSIAAVEDWLIAEIKSVVGEGTFKSIESGPGEWSEAYLARVVGFAPAIRVAFLGGQPRERAQLSLDTRWVIYVLTGWGGATRKTRVRGKTGTGLNSIGAYRAIVLLAPYLHNAMSHTLEPAAEDRRNIGLARVAGVQNLWTGKVDKHGLALFALLLTVEIPLDAELNQADYDDFLKAGIDWDLPDVGVDVDAADLITLPQEAT